MTAYELEVRRRQTEEFLVEARDLSRKFPNIYGGVIFGQRNVRPDELVAIQPKRLQFPELRGWSRHSLLAAITKEDQTCLYYGNSFDAAIAYLRFAQTIWVHSFKYGTDSSDREMGHLGVDVAPQVLLATMALYATSNTIKLGMSVERYDATHSDWLGRCEVRLIRQDLFRSVAYWLSTQLAGLALLRCETAAGTEQHTSDPSISFKTPKEPSKKAFECYRYSILTGEKQVNIANFVYGSHGKQSQVSKDLTCVREWLNAGNILPSLTESKPLKVLSRDPSQLDQIPRSDRKRKLEGPKQD